MAISVPEQGRLRHPISYFRTELYATPAYRSDTPWCIRADRLSTSDADGFSRAPRLVLCIRFLFTSARALSKKRACSDRFKIIASAIIVHPLYSAVSRLGRAICKSPVVEEVQYFCPPIVDCGRQSSFFRSRSFLAELRGATLHHCPCCASFACCLPPAMHSR